MKVHFSQTGGFAGISIKCELDTDRMSAAEAAQLRALLALSGVELAQRKPRFGKAFDLFSYAITVDDNGKSYRAKFDDLSLPAKARPLVEFLRTKSSGYSPH